MKALLRTIAVVALLAVAAFCLFGFLATFEWEHQSDRWAIQFIYGVLCLGGLGGAVALLRNRRGSRNGDRADGSG